MKIKTASEREREREWDRLKRAAEHTGFSRPELFRAVVRGDIVGVHIKKPGAKKGMWLVNLESLDQYIRSYLPGGSRHNVTSAGLAE
jgi:hypothetical protein